MAQHLRLARLFWLLLAIFTIGRLLMSRVPYDKGHHVFSLVTLTASSPRFLRGLHRRWLNYRVLQAMMLGGLIALSAQIVIFVVTGASYIFGVSTYFTQPRALLGMNAPPEAVPFAQAMLARTGGLVANTITSAILGGLGWAMGGLLPAETAEG